jgi:hypothetical protein
MTPVTTALLAMPCYRNLAPCAHAVAARYRSAGRTEKGLVLDELRKLTGWQSQARDQEARRWQSTSAGSIAEHATPC